MIIRLLLLVPVLLYTTHAYAYIDPGMGSMFVQMLIAGFLGFLGLLKIYWANVKAFLNKNKTSPSTSEFKKTKSDDDKEDETSHKSA